MGVFMALLPLIVHFRSISLMEHITQVAAAAGLKENPQRHVQELMRQNDPAMGAERHEVFNTRGHESGTRQQPYAGHIHARTVAGLFVVQGQCRRKAVTRTWRVMNRMGPRWPTARRLRFGFDGGSPFL
jgi:hypothetical protein